MPLTSTTTDYDMDSPRLFEEEAGRLRPVFGDASMGVHHVGSTAVVGLAAKPEIDILVVVSETKHLDQWQASLLHMGYDRGSDLNDGHHFFKRDTEGRRTHKLHVCASGHPQISRMLMLRDHLRSNTQDRMAYETLKLRLEKENQTGIAEYLKGKAPFLDELYGKIRAQQ